MAVDLPGIQGKDYHFISYGGQNFAVYTVQIPGGGMIHMTFRIDKPGFMPHGVHVQHITNSQFQSLQHMGDISEVTKRGDQRHPFQQYLSHLQELYGNISWMHDKQFLGVMLSGWAKNWSSSEIQQRLTRTSWYQQRTDAQRSWLTLSTSEKAARTSDLQTQMRDGLMQIYGPNVDWAKHVSQSDIEREAQNIASGEFGDPATGLQTWLQRRTFDAQGIEGTQAWTDQEQKAQQLNAFKNQPEDIYQQILQQSKQWLGPNATPSDQTLRQWSTDLASGTKAQGDWQQFLQDRTKSLYPYLSPGEDWQSRADAYKNIAEQQLGTPVGYNDPLLQKIGQVDAKGQSTGAPVSSTEFQQIVRQDPRFWQSQTAKQEGFSVLGSLNQMFNGVG